MKLYRVTMRRTYDEHDGYEYYSSKTQAEQWQKHFNNLYKDDGFTYKDKVDEIEFDLTKKGVIELLREVASHPDNG